MISVLILTKNEAQDLPGCLDSVRWSDDIHVYDSCSTDRTVDIARAAGAHVTQRAFDDWSSHQNWGLANVAFRYPWVFYLDADERVSPELAAGLKYAVRNSGDNVAFRNRRRDFWDDRWLKHVIPSPFNIRLFRPEKIRYERLVNPVVVVDGPIGEVGGYVDHYPFSKGLTHWLNRHNSYSSFEARQILQNGTASRGFSLLHAFLGKDLNQRRFHQKELFYRIPARPLLKFLLLYIARGGFLDGRAGFNYALLQSFYETMIVLKTKELATNPVAPKEVNEGPQPVQSGTNGLSLEAFHANPGRHN